MTKTKKKELKARLLKILHGVCYVLSAIFVLVLIVASVKGCSSKKRQVNIPQSIAPQQLVNNSNIPYYFYFSEFTPDGTNIIDLEKQQLICGDGLDLLSATTDTETYSKNIYDKSLMGGEFISYDGSDVLTISYISISYSPFELSSSDNTKYYRLYNIYYGFTNGTSYAVLSKSTALANDYSYDTYDFALRYSVSSDVKSYFDEPPLNYLFEPSLVSDFVFNKQFNYNAPMGLPYDSPYGIGASWTSSTQYTAHLDYDTGWFVSNGQLFNKIQYWCTSAGDSDFEILSSSGTSKISQGATGSWAYIWLYYVNTETNVSVIANYRNQVAYLKDTNTNAYYYQNSSTWQNDEYRYIYFLDELSDSLSTKIQAFNNNNQYFGGSINGGSPFDVFTLIGSAFTGLMPLLSIMVLPNITLGMLLLVPLVAILVFAIVKIVKK